MRVYTVLVSPLAAEPEREARLVKEGFCWPAFFFTAVWALWHGLWLAAGLIALAGLALDAVLRLLGADPVTETAAAVALAAVVGCLGNDLRRWALERRGWRIEGVVAAADHDAALRRYIDLRLETPDPQRPAPGLQ